MKFFISVLLAALCIAVSSCREHDDPMTRRPPKIKSIAEVEQFAWLVGKWQRISKKNPHRMTFEEWQQVSTHRLTGRLFAVSNGDTTVLETLKLEKLDGNIIYEATVDHNAGPVAFTLVEFDARGIVFENRQHDFPNRIVYYPPATGKDSLRVTISDNANSRKVDFLFVKR